MRQRFVTVCLFVAAALGAVTAQQAPAGAAPSSGDPDYAAPLRQKLAEHGIPGLSCAIAIGDRIVFAEGFGRADVENDVPATADTVYRLASISKPITAVLAMQLVEQGALDLDAPVHTLVEGWPEKRWPVTTRQLLGHLGGVRHYTKKDGPAERTQRYPNQTASLSLFAADELEHEPGTRYRYSTYGFNLVAAVVEARAGADFAQLVHDRIAMPCGAPSLQDDDQRRLIRHRAQGYRRRGGDLQNSELMDSSYKLGGGGLCSSAPDLVRFAQALMKGKLVRPETLATMYTTQSTNDGKPTGYGLGFGVRRVDGVEVVSHSGAQSRVSTMLVMLPEDRVAVAALCNLEGVKLQQVAVELAMAARRASASRSGSEAGR